MRILTEPRNSLLKQYQKLMEMEGIQLTFTNDAIEWIAQKAMDFNLGARGLRSICEAIMTDAMFDLPSQKDLNKTLVVDAAYAAEKLGRAKINRLKAA
jgi:ATP-dependent Clp protease ATP-binding subunit ClpX